LSSTLLDPRVLDASTLIPRATQAVYMPIGVEGQADTVGTAAIATPARIDRIDQANTLYGPSSSLTRIVQAVLDRGAGPVFAVASAKGAVPTTVQRQAAWQTQESDTVIRIRLTDSEVQADLAALAVSAKNADLIYNKQIVICGMPSGTSKTNLIAAASSVAADTTGATKTAMVGPGVYDSGGTLRGGSYAAACVAAEIAKNSDPAMDLDLWPLPLLTGVELDAAGLPVFRRKVVSGSAVNDYEDLLQGGISPIQPARVPGGAQTTHLRTISTVNTTYDNLYTRVIQDQVFIDVRDYILDNNFLRLGNTQVTRTRIKSGVQAVLEERSAWIAPVTQPDGSQGYNVSVTPSADMRQVTVGYQGVVVRGINTVLVAANLTIPV
jgi:hypothetical protein